MGKDSAVGNVTIDGAAGIRVVKPDGSEKVDGIDTSVGRVTDGTIAVGRAAVTPEGNGMLVGCGI